MIRPITALCAIAACASGLYLYQSKHRVSVLDTQIENIVHQTAKMRARTRVLQAEWMVLNDPQRLQSLATQLLSLKPVAPAQFTTMAELDTRLPPVGVPPADALAPADPGAETDGPVVAIAEPATVVADTAPATAVANAAPTALIANTTPGPAVAATPSQPGLMATAQAATADRAAADRAATNNATGPSSPLADHPTPERVAAAMPVASLARVLSPHPTSFHPAVAHSPIPPRPAYHAPEPRPAAPGYARVERRAPIAHPIAPRPVAAPLGGSLLGMAHAGLAPPAPIAAPVPGPVSQAAWTSDR